MRVVFTILPARMKWFTKIFLAFCIFLNCTVVTAANRSFHQVTSLLKPHSQQNIYSQISRNNSKFLPRILGKRISRLIATEYEDDTEASGGKKQTLKANLADIFLNTHGFISCFTTNNSFFNNKLFTALVLNKVYLTIKVFRL